MVGAEHQAMGEGAAAARRNARLYLTGVTGSFVGGSAMILAAGIWVKSLTGSSSLAALVSVCIYAPSLLGPLAGLLADRVRRRRLLVAVNLITAGTLLLLLAVRSEGDIWLTFVVMTWYGAALALVDPAEQALFVVMLPNGRASAHQRLEDEPAGGRQTGCTVGWRRPVLPARWRGGRGGQLHHLPPRCRGHLTAPDLRAAQQPAG